MSISMAKFARLAVAASVLTVLFAPMVVNALDEPQSAPTVCLDKDGQIKKGEIDVLVLLDNSGSLDTTVKGSTPTDPNGKRFDALNEFIDSFSELGCLGYWELPPGMVPPEEDGDTTEADSYLAGSPSFKVLEIEVFKLE